MNIYKIEEMKKNLEEYLIKCFGGNLHSSAEIDISEAMKCSDPLTQLIASLNSTILYGRDIYIQNATIDKDRPIKALYNTIEDFFKRHEYTRKNSTFDMEFENPSNDRIGMTITYYERNRNNGDIRISANCLMPK